MDAPQFQQIHERLRSSNPSNAANSAVMIPACVLGDLTAAVALDGPLAPLNHKSAELTGVLVGTRARIGQSPLVTKQQKKQQGTPEVAKAGLFEPHRVSRAIQVPK